MSDNQRPPSVVNPAANPTLSGHIDLTSMHPLIHLRWLAVIGQITTILFVHYVFGVNLPLSPMAVVLACLIGFNLVSMWWWRNHVEVSRISLFLALLVDVATLTAQLYLSGGATNPFVFLYLLQVVLGAVLLPLLATWVLAAITGLCFVGLTLWSGPVAIPREHYLDGLLICFALNAALLVVFINRINGMLRAHDARLIALRERASEEEHIVRMGLLASGAAHELGTPLATISVILGDWKHLPAIASEPELLEELSEMQLQLDRCKAIVSGILLSAGNMRAEALIQTTVSEFLDDVVAGWRATRPVRKFDYVKRVVDDLTIVSDEGLKQTICNILDNALEASPEWLAFEAFREGDDLMLRVFDNGPGFAPSMLERVGQPYQSTKGRPGGGLGLFLAVNVVRALGGHIETRNRELGGALVTLTLPLASLTLEPPIEASTADEL